MNVILFIFHTCVAVQFMKKSIQLKNYLSNVFFFSKFSQKKKASQPGSAKAASPAGTKAPSPAATKPASPAGSAKGSKAPSPAPPGKAAAVDPKAKVDPKAAPAAPAAPLTPEEEVDQ